jgi:4-aminobutyrate aminotransferase-like enzyme
MRHAGVLIGRTGRHGNVLKIRPPLIFRREHADQVAQTLASVLAREGG